MAIFDSYVELPEGSPSKTAGSNEDHNFSTAHLAVVGEGLDRVQDRLGTPQEDDAPAISLSQPWTMEWDIHGDLPSEVWWF